MIMIMEFIQSHSTFIVFILNLGLIYKLFRLKYSYWKSRNIPFVPPTIPFGNCQKIFMQKQSFAEFMYDLHFAIKQQKEKYAGFYFFTKPMLCVNDPEMIKQVLVKDFWCFHDRDIYHDERFDPLSANLFSLVGNGWKSLRKTFTPTFTSGKMKMMFRTMRECSKELENVLGSSGGEIDIKDVSARFTTDIIGSCAFGIECNSLKNPQVDFLKMGVKNFTLTPKEMLKNVCMIASPKLMKYFEIPLIADDVSQFFMTITEQTVRYREENQIERNDFMNLLIKLKNKESIDGEVDAKGISFNQLAAQAYLFFIAGFETSSSTMAFCMYELPKNVGVQKKLRQEIRRVVEKSDGEVTYEDIMGMKYLDCVIHETLRLYPILPMILRDTVEDYPIPGTNQIIPKHTQIWIPIMGLHKDPDYFPHPQNFDPERFNDVNRPQIPPFVYMPFGEGPRNCIGMRFGLLQTKLGIFGLLKDHEYSLGPNGLDGVKFSTKSITLSFSDRIILNCNNVS